MPLATEKISFFTLNGWHTWEGGYSCTHDFELTHGGKNRGTHFTHTWLVQRTDCNHSRKVVPPHYPQIYPPQSPAGPISGLGLGIRPRLGAINCTPE